MNLSIDASTEAFLHPNDPILKRYNEFKDQFGREDLIIIAIETENIFDVETLKKIELLHDTIEEKVPNIDEINSLINARVTYADSKMLVVGELLEDWPKKPQDLAKIRNLVNSNPLFINQLISKDGLVTTLTISLNTYSSGSQEDENLENISEETEDELPYLSDSESRRTIQMILSIVKQFDEDDFSIRVSGIPTVTTEIGNALQQEMRMFMVLAVLTIGICLMAMFGRIFGVLCPLFVVILSLISTLGVMGHAGVSIKISTIILPSFLLAVGVGASVHIISIFCQKFRSADNRVTAIVKSYGHSGLAVILTSVTTAIGLASFSTAEVSPIADLGVFACVGIGFALFYTFTLLPSLLVLLRIRPYPNHSDSSKNIFDKLLLSVANFSINRAKIIVCIFLTVLFFFLGSAAQLRFSHDPLGWMPANSDIVKSTKYIDDKLRGTIVLEILIDTKRENGLHDPSILRKMDRLASELSRRDKDPYIGKAISVVDILKEIHQALNDGEKKYYKVPENQKLISQEFLLFELAGSDDLETFVDSTFQTARFTIRVPWRDALVYTPFLKETKTFFEEEFEKKVSISTTGMMSILSRTLEAAIYSAAKSYIIALTVISLVIILMLGNLKLGLISMLPNISPIIFTMGSMYWLDIPLNLFTMLIASIGIGLAVDDTIHFMHNFSRAFGSDNNFTQAVQNTFITSGKAMLVTTIVLSVGFYIFLFSNLNNIIQFGFLTGTAIILALISDFLFLPALLQLFLKKTKL